MRRLALLTTALISMHSQAIAIECISNPREFDFLNTSAQIFYFGGESDVRGAYDKLKTELERSGVPAETTLYFTRDRFSSVQKAGCEKEKCTGRDILAGLNSCSSGPASPDNMCYPLAAAYRGKLYCMLAPGLDNYGDGKPYQDFNPYSDQK